MKNFSFKVLYVSIFIPSILYVLTLPYVERWAEQHIAQAVRHNLIENDMAVLQGLLSIYDEVNVTVSETLNNTLPIRLGAEATVRITDPQANALYPYYEHLLQAFRHQESTPPPPLGSLFNPQGFIQKDLQPGQDNILDRYTAYIDNVRIAVSINIPVTSWLGSAPLLAYILLMVTGLYAYYQRSSRLAAQSLQELQAQLEHEKSTLASQVDQQLRDAHQRLAEIKNQEEEWLREVERLEREKNSLEEELLETMEQSEEQQEKIGVLEEEVIRKSRKPAKAEREQKVLAKRFAKLYRNLDMAPKVFEEIVRLRDEQQKLQAEEVMKRLNDHDPSLNVRRKIGGVEKCDVLELGFGAKGRIYYELMDNGRYRILRIGTKTTQAKDLAFLAGHGK